VKPVCSEASTESTSRIVGTPGKPGGEQHALFGQLLGTRSSEEATPEFHPGIERDLDHGDPLVHIPEGNVDAFDEAVPAS